MLENPHFHQTPPQYQLSLVFSSFAMFNKQSVSHVFILILKNLFQVISKWWRKKPTDEHAIQ